LGLIHDSWVQALCWAFKKSVNINYVDNREKSKSGSLKRPN